MRLVALLVTSLLVSIRGAEPLPSARDLVLRGMAEFRAGQIKESVQSFEAATDRQPVLRPQLWQLGISYYYAGAYEKGRKLFEQHQKVNPQDVENAIWHFLCAAKIGGVDAARKNFISITGDSRVPMKELHELFSGQGSREQVLEAAGKGNASGEERKQQMFHASLYLGLYEEAIGHADESLKWIRQAAGEFSQPHYMGDVARVHLRQRTGKER